MTLIDLISIATILTCLYGIARWLIVMRSWPLRWSVSIALLANISFYVARSSGLFSPTDLNLYSAVRVFVTVLIVALIPSVMRVKAL